MIVNKKPYKNEDTFCFIEISINLLVIIYQPFLTRYNFGLKSSFIFLLGQLCSIYEVIVIKTKYKKNTEHKLKNI